tara:strand:+ start:58 stop:666 length:609 start_codon:yes stop_codon:yes gene_type:complete
MPLINLFNHVLDNDQLAVKDYLAANRGGARAKSLSIVYAAALGHADMVQSMLDRGIPINTFDVFNNFQRTWEPLKLKKFQQIIERDMKPFTRGWSPMLTAACVAAFYGHTNVLKVLYKHDFECMSFNPYLTVTSVFIGNGEPPSWNAATCALFGQKWSIASALVDRGVVTTDMKEQYPLFLEFRIKVKIPRDVIRIVFSYLA